MDVWLTPFPSAPMAVPTSTRNNDSRTTAGSLPPWVPGEEKQTSYAAPSVLQPLILVFAAVVAGTAADDVISWQ